MKTCRIIDPNIDIWGRCSIKDDSLFLYWSGSGIEFNIKSSEAYISVNSVYDILEHWLLVIINDAVTQRILLPKGKSEICLFRGLDKNTLKNVKVVKDSQPFYEDTNAYLEFIDIKHDGEIFKPEKHKYNLEFIGDSLASGESIAASSIEEDFSPQNATANNFVMMTARLLDAKYSCMSIGGWGVKCSWDNNMDRAMPLLYDKICGVMDGEDNKKHGSLNKYEFNDDKDYIIVHLGTNDTNAILRKKYPFYDTEDKVNRMKDLSLTIDEEEINDLSSYVYKFISTLKKNNPSSKIIWLYGVMLIQAEKAFIKAVDDYCRDNNDNTVFYLRSVNGLNDLWAHHHPSKRIHEMMANQIVEKIREIELTNH